VLEAGRLLGEAEAAAVGQLDQHSPGDAGGDGPAGGRRAHPGRGGAAVYPGARGRPDLRLTPREVEVLRLVGQGRGNDQIARELFLSVRTVERHLANIYRKIGVTGSTARATATAFAHRNHLL
jgi:DNA-binding NarL/FixJ family response regulator